MARIAHISALSLFLLILNLALVHGYVTAGVSPSVIARVAAQSSTGPGISIFRRDGDGDPCVKGCSPAPACDCDTTITRCEVTVQTCIECSVMKCVPLAKKSTSKEGPSTGAVVGACVGGLAGAALIGFLVYRFCVRGGNRGRLSMATAAEKENDFGMLKSARVCFAQLWPKGKKADEFRRQRTRLPLSPRPSAPELQTSSRLRTSPESQTARRTWSRLCRQSLTKTCPAIRNTQLRRISTSSLAPTISYASQ